MPTDTDLYEELSRNLSNAVAAVTNFIRIFDTTLTKMTQELSSKGAGFTPSGKSGQIDIDEEIDGMPYAHLKSMDVSNSQSSTNTTVMTPPSSNGAPYIVETHSTSSSTPWQGCTYIIRYSKTGEVLTFVDGEVVLEKPGGRGCIKWDCVETGGWVGFKSPVSGRYIGQHDGELVCDVDHHLWCEHFIARPVPEGGFVLLMREGHESLDYLGGGLRVVGSKEVHGKKKVAKVDGDAIIWDFVKV
ncbi:hypothetical protein Vi05172_g5336 [Venturia inaequalis]|nr:hypothetical protein Vi05172_g5336 [Venturia inaequalis]